MPTLGEVADALRLAGVEVAEGMISARFRSEPGLIVPVPGGRSIAIIADRFSSLTLPNGRVHHQRDADGDDRGTAEVMSKVLLLAADDAITDPSIIAQIERHAGPPVAPPS